MTQATVYSLRLRLFLLIVTPLILVALILGYWRYAEAQRTAEQLFDRGLLSTALAISRDVAISEGDALSPTTRDLIEQAAGGEIFYHVTGPGGIYVTGYAYPPRFSGEVSAAAPIYGLAQYRGEAVRVLKMTERTSIGNLSGNTTVTVWQRIGGREQLARALAFRTAALMFILLICLGLVVWFGVHQGLRPLRDLHAAIALRSPDDLRRIERPLPVEVAGIVATLNRLFEQLRSNFEARKVFISNAAHQLRNPAAAILSLAETLDDTDDPVERRRRTAELVEAARASTALTNQLLSFERLRHGDGNKREQAFDLRDAAQEACLPIAGDILNREIDLSFETCDQSLPVLADRLMVIEAIRNLVDNAVRHGGASLDRITLTASRSVDMATITVDDNGRGLDPIHAGLVLERFGQLEPGPGSGLGLPIVKSIAEHHGGSLRINRSATGASLTFSLPMVEDLSVP